MRLTNPIASNPPAMAVADAATKYGARSCWLFTALVVVVIEAVAAVELEVERAGWLLVEVAVVLDEEMTIVELDVVVVDLVVLVVVTAGGLVVIMNGVVDARPS